MSKGKFAAHVIQIMPHDVTVHDCCVGGCYNMFGFFERSYFTLAIIRRIYFYIVIKVRCAMADKRRNPKDEAMACDGAFNPRPDAVRDVLFLDNPFFDAGDLVQVRYEMVRRHQVDRMAISEVVSLFGVTRPTFYKARSALAEHGLVGLIPRQRGPKGGHKLSAEVISYIDHLKVAQPDLTIPQCVDAIAAHFGITVHRRSLERAMAVKKKQRGRP